MRDAVLAVFAIAMAPAVGLGVARSSAAIRAGIVALVRDGAPGMAEAQRSQSWAVRVATARASAED